MTEQPWSPYATRFLLPLALALAAVGAWFIASQLNSVERAAPASPSPTSDLPVASARRLPALITGSSQQAAIDAALIGLPPDPGGLSCVSVLVDGQQVLERRSDRTLVPGYAQLLLTGHTALDVLGPDFRFETQVFAEAVPDDSGRISRGIYLVGGGDPVLMSYEYTLGFRPILSTRTPIEELAQRLVDAGVERIERGIVAVERRYDLERSMPGWPDELQSDGSIGPLTALQLDDGFAVRAASNLGVAVPAEQPATWAAEQFADELRERDVQVSGTLRTLGETEELPSLVKVASIQSPPLSEIVFQMWATNDSSAAEMLMKEVGLAESSEGTTQAGGQAVQRVLQDLDIEVSVPFRSGSGLDPIGGTTCAQLAQTADRLSRDHPSADQLPLYWLPGVLDGALAEIEVDADLRAIGGERGDVSSMVATTVGEGRRVTIATITNRPGGANVRDRDYQRALVEAVDALAVAGVAVDEAFEGAGS